jgi:thiol-disulfide isomerase/thioredoxin
MMKKLTLIILCLMIAVISFSQEKTKKYAKIPSVDIKTVDGESFNTSEISNDGKPIIISFWALWCKPCIREMTAIADVEFLLDPNGDFKRAMNVNMIPHTFLLNGKGEIVWQHTSFAEGSELELYELVQKVTKGEDINE